MPGTIFVSVLDLVDLPSSSSCSTDEGSVKTPFLQVAMGRKEYRTNGSGDFSFPVSSLRENLVVSLHDADGNEISRTDVKTMEIIEKGSWDSWFPFKGGGSAHLKLQFSISQGDQKRVYKMRESVVKTKYADLLIGDTADSAPSEETGGVSTQQTTTKPVQLSLPDVVQEDALVKEMGERETIVCPYNKAPNVHYEKPSYEDIFPLEAPSNNICDSNDAIEDGLHTKLERASTITEEVDVAWLCNSPKFREDAEPYFFEELVYEESRRGMVKKMISSFENMLSQKKKKRKSISHPTAIKRTFSLEELLFTEDNSEKRQSGETMRKSLSMGMLSEIDLEWLPNNLKRLDGKEGQKSVNSSLSNEFHTNRNITEAEENQKLKRVMISEVNAKTEPAGETMMNYSPPLFYDELLNGKEENNGSVINKVTINTNGTNETIGLEEKQMVKVSNSQELNAIIDHSFMKGRKSTRDNPCSGTIKNEVIPCMTIISNTEGSGPLLERKRNLIRQVARMTILVVAFGALVMKSR